MATTPAQMQQFQRLWEHTPWLRTYQGHPIDSPGFARLLEPADWSEFLREIAAGKGVRYYDSNGFRTIAYRLQPATYPDRGLLLVCENRATPAQLVLTMPLQGLPGSPAGRTGPLKQALEFLLSRLASS